MYCTTDQAAPPTPTHRARYWRCYLSSGLRSSSCLCRWKAATRTPRRARCPSRRGRRRRRCRRDSRPSTRSSRPLAKTTASVVSHSHPVEGEVSRYKLVIQLRSVEKLTVFFVAGKAATAGRTRRATRPRPAIVTCLFESKLSIIKQ